MPRADAAPAEPKSLLDRVGAALPVALTAIATAFAGMSTSEMSQAMYWRSAAAQDQAKATDQWSFAGFKRDRSLIVQTTAAQLRALAGYRPGPATAGTTPTPEIVERVGQWMASDENHSAPPPVENEAIQRVLNAIHHRRPEPEVLALARQVDVESLNAILNTAASQSVAVERAWEAELDRLRKLAQEAATTAGKGDNPARIAEANALQAILFELDARRYRAESTMNFWVGFLYEVRVRTSTATSDRHRERSKNFFYAMLAAQVGATVASLGLARRHGSALWLLAGIAGIVAVGFGTYVYLGM